MAPQGADVCTPWGASSYLPSPLSIDALRKDLQLAFQSLGSNPSTLSGPQPPDSSGLADGVEADECILRLSLDEIQEIEGAIAYFEQQELPLNKLQAQYFPLPTLGPRLRERSLLLHKEKPFFILRGIGPQWFSKRRNVIVFLGIASHVGTKRAFTKGDPTVLHHITNMDIRSEGGEVTYHGPPNRSIAMPFHNDYGEVVSLYTLSRPASGGDFFLADIHDIAARIKRTRPDLLDVLRKPYTMSHPGADCGYEERPLLFDTPSNGMVIQLSRSRLCNGFQSRPSAIGELSTLQIQALDALHAAGQEVAHRISFRRGDMVFFNNMRMMHARDAYVDGDPRMNTTARYLLRLILRDGWNPKWEVPDGLRQMWKELHEHDDDEEVIPVYPRLVSLKASH